MAECVNVAVDAMGGDNAPTEIVKGAVEAVNADKRVKVFLVGKEPVIREELKAYTYDAEQLEVVHAEEVIETAEPPVMAIRRKKDSSIVKAMYMVKNGECDAFVSAGSTGAVLVGGQVIVGRIRGETSFGSPDPYGERCQPFAGLWSQRRCETFHVSPVCQDGQCLYGKRYGSKESESRYCEYRRRGGEGQRTGKRNLPAS